MSRICATTKDGNQVAFGLDHAVGWYYQEFDTEEECVVDLDQSPLSPTKFNKGILIGKLQERLPDSEVKRLERQIECIFMDLDPGNV